MGFDSSKQGPEHGKPGKGRNKVAFTVQTNGLNIITGGLITQNSDDKNLRRTLTDWGEMFADWGDTSTDSSQIGATGSQTFHRLCVRRLGQHVRGLGRHLGGFCADFEINL